MNTETLEYKGYKIVVTQDDSPENPFESWDCEPPIITYYADRHGYAKSYQGAPETIGDVIRLMPDWCFERGKRMEFIREHINCSLEEFAEMIRDHGDLRSAFIERVTEQVGSKPEGWRAAKEWFEVAEALLDGAGIPCLNAQSNGYSQGDSTLVLVIATEEWLKLTGVTGDVNIQSNLQGAVDLYSAWAWGDVYGISEIIDPDGKELDDGSVWGFYGRDHKENGLLESAHGTIDWHINQLKETALNEPACLI